ncbi:MAG: trypsin-like peptidase domain-containing protein [Vicinamibacterales bacterium]
MTRGFAWLTAALTGTVGVLVGVILSDVLAPGPTPQASAPMAERASAMSAAPMLAPIALPGAVSFADIAERMNQVVVSIDASARRRPRTIPDGRRPELPESPLEERRRRSDDSPRRGMGTGFLIDEQGRILTNHHVIEGAERITVKLADGRTFRAAVVGSDPDTDIALIKVESSAALPHAVLGNSDVLRVGEWVLAIGNPLAYEHTVTVGVVSFVGRKLFDSSLDNYIQTDASISFGNSGGPLINTRGEVVGINSAVSRQNNNIGFAVPINQARAILPQLTEDGRVSRGYIGVALRDVDPDVQASLHLTRSDGALVQDVTAGSPGARAGIKPYDLIVSVDGKAMRSNDELIRRLPSASPAPTPAWSSCATAAGWKWP